jgi:orotate phosphoribosyltransferase
MSTISQLIEESGAIKYGKFTLASGTESNYYIDKYLFETQPDILGPIALEISDMIDSNMLDVVAGPELGAVPLVTAVSLTTGLNAAFIRKSEKDHGTKSRIEGVLQSGQSVVLLEDVTTTGSTMLDSVDLIENTIGANIKRLIVIVDRNEGAVENFKNHGLDLEYLVQIGTDIKTN